MFHYCARKLVIINDYLNLASKIAGKDISERIHFFGEKEAELVITPDSDFKFHSGTPIKTINTNLIQTEQTEQII